MQNLKNRTNEHVQQNRNRLTDTESKPVVSGCGEGEGMGEIIEGD